MAKRKYLVDEYRYAGFRALATVRIHPDDADGRIITLRRRQKKRYAAVAGRHTTHSTTGRYGLSATCAAEMPGYTSQSRYAECHARSAEK
jgi:hypothetical protein